MGVTTEQPSAGPRSLARDPRAAVNLRAPDRVGLLLVIVASVVAIILAIVTLSTALRWRSQMFLGALVTRELVVDATLPVDTTLWPAVASGMVSSDRILTINDVRFASGETPAWARYQEVLAGLTPGTPVTLTFERPATNNLVRIRADETCASPSNGFALCTVTFTPGRFPDADFLSLFMVPFLSGLISIIMGIVLLLARTRLATARTAGGASLMFGVFCIAFFDLNTSHLFSRLWLMSTGIMAGSLTAFALMFPTPMAILRRYPWSRIALVIVGVIIGFTLIVLHENPVAPRSAILAPLLAGVMVFVGAILLALSLLVRRRTATTPTMRDQVNTVLIGCSIGLVLGLLWLFNAVVRFLGQPGVPLNTQPAMPLLLVTMFSLTYAVLRYRAFDSDRLISQSITYVIMSFALIVGYFLLILAASLVVGQAVSPNNPIVLAIAIFGIAALFVPIRTRLQERIDRIYYRQRADYSAATETFGRQLGMLGEADVIIERMREAITVTLKPRQIYMFLRDSESGDYTAEGTDLLFAQSSPLLDALRNTEGPISLVPGEAWDRDVVAEKARLGVLDAQVVAGLFGTNRVVNGFIVLAPPRGTGGLRGQAGIYNVEALRFIENLTAQASVAFERSQVVDSLEQRVRELNAFSQISQGVNFTIEDDIEIDYLLELIYAQTARLITATHFYITLYEENLRELYHAFFVENDVRQLENENRRWRVGSDLFSEVIRTGQNFCVADYTEALDNYGAVAIIEDRKMRAWMGVPLIAGGRTIGVLSAGSTEAGRRFGDEQVKTLGDIGLLAANSLDKARLFRETNARARQLAALNEITSQIVAAEKDVDRLLRLITQSATEILGAEAGSLLLAADDDSGDLEFKVAIGGGGGDLIGARVPAGRGLVGEVASTAGPVIVNDVGTDPRWGGEVAKEGAFRTSSVLAVPLMTQNRVIGVLEVLNKKTSGGFSPDDTRLLIAFAAQAAVAIENARLFQMTDLQLSQRVSELETMERIDVELNRSLDVKRVAELTVRSAMDTSGASAGMLGVVVGDPAHLRIIYREGYGDQDVPMGAEGDRYPIELGIVSRVIRTRQPEVVPDVRIDPNYVPSLRGALSQITLPMLSGGAVNAVLILETNRDPRLRLADMPFLQRLVEHASVAIVNAQLYDEVERANQSKSEFVSFVAHELKNPLTSIQGYSELLIKGAAGGLADPVLSSLRTIRSNAVRMNTLVSDLNDVTKLQTNNMRLSLAVCDFRIVLEETLRPLQAMMAEKAQTLALEVADDLPPLWADEGRLIQVLTNLVSNAHKYSPPESTITIAAFVDEMLQNQRGRLIDPQVHISVRDQGIGMSKDDLNKLFTPYFRSDNPLAQEQPGTGLGLTITRGIVDGHGGLIWADSTLGSGTTFHFTCPIAQTVTEA